MSGSGMLFQDTTDNIPQATGHGTPLPRDVGSGILELSP